MRCSPSLVSDALVSHTVLLPKKASYRVLTDSCNQCPGAQKQDIDGFLFPFDLFTYSIYAPNQTHICFDEGILCIGIQLLDLNSNAIRSFLGSTDVVDTRFGSKTGKLLESVFADAVSTTYEDGHEAKREAGGDTSVGSLDCCKGDHLIICQAVTGK